MPILLLPIPIDPLDDRLLLEHKPGSRFEILRGALDVVLGPTDSFSFDEDMESFPVVFLQKELFHSLSFCHQSIQALGFNPLSHLVRELACRYGIVLLMGGKRESVELGDAIRSNEPERIPEIRIGLAWEPDDEIRSNIDLHPILPLERAEVSEYLQEFGTVVVAIHAPEDSIRSGLDGQVHIGTNPRILEEPHQSIIDKLDTQARHAESRKGGFFENLREKLRKPRVGDVFRASRTPCSEVGPGQDHFFSPVRDECIDLCDNVFAGSRLVPSASLDGQAKSTKIIAPGLDDDELLGMESGPEYSGFLEPFLE